MRVLDRAERRRLDQTNADGDKGRRTRGADLAKASQSRTSPLAQGLTHTPLLQLIGEPKPPPVGVNKGGKGNDWGGVGEAARKRKPGTRKAEGTGYDAGRVTRKAGKSVFERGRGRGTFGSI